MLAEGLLDQSILTGVEGEDSNAAAGFEDAGQLIQEGIQHLKFAVHINAQGLEGALSRLFYGLFALFLGEEGEGLLNNCVKLTGGVDGLTLLEGLEDGFSDLFGVGFIGVFHQHVDQFVLVQFLETLGGADACGGIQTQVQGTVMLESKAAIGVVDLHGGHAQIGQNEIEFLIGGHLIQLGEVHSADGQDLGAEAEVGQPLAGLFRLNGVHIGGVHVALTLQLLQHPAGMAAVAQGGVIAHLTGLDLEKIQNFVDHNGDVHTGRGLAVLDDLGHIVLILFGVEFFVLFFIVPGVGTLITHAALVFLFHQDQLLCPLSYHSLGKKRRKTVLLA